MLQNSEYILIPTRKNRLLFFTHPYRATWPKGLSARSGRPCTTRAGPASSRGSKSSWKRNIRFISQHPTYDALYTIHARFYYVNAFTMYPVVELHSRVENFVYHIPKTRPANVSIARGTGWRKQDFRSSLCAYKNVRAI